MSRSIAVAIQGDTVVEANEVFYVDLSAPTGASLADARAVGTIRNDDGPGTLVFSASGTRKSKTVAAR
jgi:hypothetical protein